MLSAIPNIITTIRFLSVIPISVFIYQGNDFFALILFIMAGLSDGLDGYLARKYNWISQFGQFLDPLADKFLIVGTLLALAFTNKLPLWFVYTVLSRDGIILVGSMLYLLLFESSEALPNKWGKHYTGWTIALFIIIRLRASLEIIPIYLEYVAMSGVLFYILLSVTSYLRKEGKEIFKHIV